MSDRHPYRQQSAEFEEWLPEERALPWRRIIAAIAVLGVIICLNLYVLSAGVQRRVDYAFLRAQSYLKKLQPHDRYLPTPNLTVIPRGSPDPRLGSGRQPEVVHDLDRARSGLPGLPTPWLMPAAVVSAPTPSPTPTTQANAPMPMPASTPTPTPTPLPSSALLEAECYEPQGWNNCGPATLAMVLCLYGWTGDQYAVAAVTKPDVDDKNVSPEEMVAYAHSLGDMYAVMGYASDMRILKRLLSAGFPAIVETWFIPEPEDEMGHYRLLTGYDDVTQQFMTQDSYQGANQVVPYAELETLWKVFNRVYVVVCEAERAQELNALLAAEQGLPGHAMDQETMYRDALAVALAEIDSDPNDRYAWFNAGTNYLGLGQYEEAAQAYDRARTLKLPWRLLWYQFGPFEAYLGVGRYQDVIDLADANLSVARNLEESYYYRALARRALGDEAGAWEDLQAALHYNPHFLRAAETLDE